MKFEFSFKNRRFVKYITVLIAAIILRIVFALITPFEMQKYIGLIIIILAIAAFFIWDYLEGKRHKRKK